MKFGKNITSQQEEFAGYHYLRYKFLKKRIKTVSEHLEVGDLPAALTSNTVFETELSLEIQSVNECFESNFQKLLLSITAISEQLSVSKGSAGSSSSSSAELQNPLTQLVQILQDVDQLRKYAVWNAVGVVKILKKRRKQTNFGLEDISAERAGWLARQTFFSGSDFAELHAAVESIGQVLVQSDLVPQSGQAVAQDVAEQCPICLNTISDMVELGCQHRFCWKCFVLGPIAFQPGEYRISQCPICRQGTEEQKLEMNGESGKTVPIQSQGALSRFLHTYFPHSVEEGGAAGSDSDEENDKSSEGAEMRDVVGQLVKVVLADSSWQRGKVQGQISSSTTEARSSRAVPSDFFETLPPKPVQDPQLRTAQKLQWLQLASYNDPLAVGDTLYCCLCSEPLLMEAVVTTPCKHHFHRVCISRIDLPQCPLCVEPLPFSWFLPSDHPLCEQGFRVVSASAYDPPFPGGPSRGSGGFPLQEPPPCQLLAADGSAMKSYLHKIPPTMCRFLDEVGRGGDAAGQGHGGDQTNVSSSASDSSTEESNSEEEVVQRIRKGGATPKVLWTANGKMRRVQTRDARLLQSRYVREHRNNSSFAESHGDSTSLPLPAMSQAAVSDGEPPQTFFRGDHI
jgi:hypothetical protein